MPRQWNPANAFSGIIAIAGILQFLVLISIAIENYPGGYSVSENFLSDLGRERTLIGEDNPFCSLIFTTAVVGLGLSLAPFLFVMPSTFSSGRSILRFAGLLSVAGLIGIGLTPYDRYLSEHYLSLAIWLFGMFVMVFSFLFIAMANGVPSKSIYVVSILVVLAIFGYAFAGYHSGYVLMQKVLACVSVVWFCLVCVTVSVSTVEVILGRKAVVEAQASEYLKKIEKGLRK